MQKLLLFLLIVFFYKTTNAQSSPDSTLKHSPLKTLSDEQYNALLKGQDLYNMALVAEINHYPHPDKVIKFKKELDLSPIQVNKLNAIIKELHRKILEMGLIVIRNEKALDSIFRTHTLNNGSLIFYANRYGLYQGELRNTILQACLTTWTLLSQQQINKFEALQKAAGGPHPTLSKGEGL
jgi:hypothetical protein